VQLFISTLAQYIGVIRHELEVANTRSLIAWRKQRGFGSTRDHFLPWLTPP